MHEKKRKRHNDSTERPAKRPEIQRPIDSDTVKVSLLQDFGEWTPVLASTPGLSLPSNLSFKPYKKPRPQSSRSAPAPEILLHSSNHAKLDYVAREEEPTSGGTGLLNHYIGIYDPEKGDLQLIPAQKLTVRATLRSSAAPPPNGGPNPAEDPSNTLSARSTLGLTFGTKKSRKAILALSENAISPSKRSQASASPGGKKLDPVANAIVSSVAASTAAMPTQEELQAAIHEAKPVPEANLAATKVEEVYTIEKLVGMPTLRLVQVQGWITAVQAGEEVKTRSRFVAHRLEPLVRASAIKKLRGLKYLLLLVEWYSSLQKPRNPTPYLKTIARKLPRAESLPRGWDSDLLTSVTARFADEGASTLNTWHVHRLLTHILALALVIDDFATDVRDIREDLRLEQKEVSALYAELGAPLTGATEGELKRLKMSRTEALQDGHRFARLKLPLRFPRMRGMKGGRK